MSKEYRREDFLQPWKEYKALLYTDVEVPSYGIEFNIGVRHYDIYYKTHDASGAEYGDAGRETQLVQEFHDIVDRYLEQVEQMDRKRKETLALIEENRRKREESEKS